MAEAVQGGAIAPAKRKVGFLLGIGILLVPFVFVWFLLRKGYSPLARIVGFGWLVLAVLIVASQQGAGGAATGSSGASGSSASSEASTQSVVPLGTAATASQLQITIEGVSQPGFVGNEADMKRAPDGGTLVVVKYAAKNAGDHPLGGFRADNLLLVDPKGVTYKSDSGDTFAYQVEADPDQKTFDDINPGITTHQAAVFEVSKTDFNPATWHAKLDGSDVQFALQ